MQNQFGVSLDGEKGVLIAPESVLGDGVLLQATDEAKNLIQLHIMHRQIAQPGTEQANTFLSRNFQYGQHRAPVKSGEAFADADARSFAKQLNDLGSLFRRNPHIVQRAFWNVAKRLGALFAAVTLKPLGVNSEFHGLCLASVTDHLTLSRPIRNLTAYLPDTARGFGLWLRPVGAQTPAGLLLLILACAVL
ncbi:MAG TPA: hypothetical protein VN578_05420 [Candidatus Binatia bacterium]|nr:hypothetical protein [Candidatus Binatia bacterium]